MDTKFKPEVVGEIFILIKEIENELLNLRKENGKEKRTTSFDD